MDFKKYKRFFAFGCSFTQYYWPTWADIIGKEFIEYKNYGQIGAGNFFIYQSLIEAIIKHKIDKNDLVMVMFSNVSREDRFTKNRGWITPGNLYFQTEYDTVFLKKYLCDHGYLMRDLNLVTGCKLVLDNVGCDYKLMSMISFDSKRSDGAKMSDIDYLLSFYNSTLEAIEPSVFDTVFNGDWNSKPIRPTYYVPWQKEKYADGHPTPSEHLDYLQTIFPTAEFSQSTLDYVTAFNNQVLLDNFSISTYKQQKALRLGIDYE